MKTAKQNIAVPEPQAKPEELPQVLFSLVIDRAMEEAEQEVKHPKAYRFHARTFRDEFGHLPIDEVTARRIEAWKLKRLREVKSTSVRHALAFLSRCFRVALRDELTEKNPLWLVKPPKKGRTFTRVLSNDEEARLLDAVRGLNAGHGSCFRVKNRELDAGIVRFALLTGLRRRELFGAEKCHLQDQWLWVEHGKTGPRWVPLSEEALAIAEEWVRQQPGSYLFYPQHPAPNRMRVGSFFTESVLQPARELAGVPAACFRVFRRTCASRLARSGVELLRITGILGHSNPQMTLRYAHLRKADLLDAVRTLQSPGSEPQAAVEPLDTLDRAFEALERSGVL